MNLSEQVRAAAEPHIGADRVPGLVVLVATADDLHVEALGQLSIGGPPVQRDSLFRIPARELTVIVLTQRAFESPALPQVHRDIQAAAYAATA